jgi:Cu(I)/Ag(I) efflux system membrane protein CusA/SilA
MIGGMITAPLLSMLVIPAAYYLLRRPSIGAGVPASVVKEAYE